MWIGWNGSCDLLPRAATHRTLGHDLPSHTGSSPGYKRGFGPETGLQTLCSPALTDSGEFPTILSPTWRVLSEQVINRWVSPPHYAQQSSSSEHLCVFTLGFLSDCQSVKADHMRREEVWGRLLWGKINTKDRPNICLSLPVNAACMLIDGADLRH